MWVSNLSSRGSLNKTLAVIFFSFISHVSMHLLCRIVFSKRTKISKMKYIIVWPRTFYPMIAFKIKQFIVFCILIKILFISGTQMLITDISQTPNNILTTVCALGYAMVPATLGSRYYYYHYCAQSLSHVQLFATPWTVVYQAPPWNFPCKNSGVGHHFLLQLLPLLSLFYRWEKLRHREFK